MVGLCPECAGRDHRAGCGDPEVHTGHLLSARPGPSSPPGPLMVHAARDTWASTGEKEALWGCPQCCVSGPRGEAPACPSACRAVLRTPSQSWVGFPPWPLPSFQYSKSQCTQDHTFPCLPESTGLPGAASWVPTQRLLAGVLKSLEGESLHSGPPATLFSTDPGGPGLRGIRHSAVTQGAVCCQHAFPSQGADLTGGRQFVCEFCPLLWKAAGF